MLLLASSVCGLFKWRQFEPEVILMAVGWYLRFSLSYRDVEELLAERGLSVDHVRSLGAIHVRWFWWYFAWWPFTVTNDATGQTRDVTVTGRGVNRIRNNFGSDRMLGHVGGG